MFDDFLVGSQQQPHELQYKICPFEVILNMLFPAIKYLSLQLT